MKLTVVGVDAIGRDIDRRRIEIVAVAGLSASAAPDGAVRSPVSADMAAFPRSSQRGHRCAARDVRFGRLGQDANARRDTDSAGACAGNIRRNLIERR